MDIENLIRNIDGVEAPLLTQRQQLEDTLNWMVDNDFEKLVQILYRIDIDEKRLRAVLFSQSEAPTATLLADLIIERQQQKAAARQRYTATDIPPDEAW
jgi:hypothetical protein